MTKDELFEQLADIEHQRWADWQKYCHDQTHHTHCEHGDGWIIHREHVERWERKRITPYAELSEEEKQSAREQVARYWPLIVAFVASFIVEQCRGDSGPAECAQRWSEEMS